MHACRSRTGFALTEVLVAIVLLLLASVSLTGHLVQSGDALNRAAVVEREVASATEAMVRVSTWTRDELGAEVRAARIHGHTVRIVPLSRTLFQVVVLGTGEIELLRTTLFRASNAP